MIIEALVNQTPSSWFSPPFFHQVNVDPKGGVVIASACSLPRPKYIMNLEGYSLICSILGWDEVHVAWPAPFNIKLKYNF